MVPGQDWKQTRIEWTKGIHSILPLNRSWAGTEPKEPNKALIGSKKPVTHFHIYRALAAASNVGPSCLSSWNYLQVLSGLWHMHRLFHPFECRDCNWQVVWGLHKSWTNACNLDSVVSIQLSDSERDSVHVWSKPEWLEQSLEHYRLPYLPNYIFFVSIWIYDIFHPKQMCLKKLPTPSSASKTALREWGVTAEGILLVVVVVVFFWKDG